MKTQINKVKKHKLYIATTDVCFLAPANLDDDELEEYAEEALKNEIRENGITNLQKPINIKECSSLKEVPKTWKNANLWGDNDEDINPKDFFLNKTNKNNYLKNLNKICKYKIIDDNTIEIFLMIEHQAAIYRFILINEPKPTLVKESAGKLTVRW